MTHPSLPNGFSRDFSEAPREGELSDAGLLDGVPIEILDAYERRAKDVAALWGNASAGARQAVIVSMLRAWHSGRESVGLPGNAVLKELAEGK